MLPVGNTQQVFPWAGIGGRYARMAKLRKEEKMMKNLKRLLSMMLALSMVFSLVVPAAATETHEHDHAEEAQQEETINMESVLENITVNAEDVEFEFDLVNKIVLADPDTEVDMEDPAIIEFESDLKNIKVWDEAAQQPVPLTEEQIQQVLGLYQQYLNHWAENADTLGLQVPFFLDYNDKGEDGLGVLGEMLALANVPVDAVRAGNMTMDDLTGMILNFYYGDQLGVQYYGKAIEAARDEVMQLIKNSGAQTEAQKLLIINDWLAHNNTFDMPYIMNADKDTNGDGVVDEKDDNKDAMVAPDPVKHEHYDDVLAVMTEVYEGILTDTFETQIHDGLKANFKTQFYTEFIKNVIYQGGLTQARQNPELVDGIKAAVGWDEAYEAAEKEVYDEAYEEFMLNNHEHDMDVTFNWKETKTGDVITGWECEDAEAVCKFEGCTVEFAVAVDTEEEVTEEATCTENGTITYTATATVTIPGIEGEDGEVGEFEETKEAVIIAAGHKDENADNICDACEEVLKAPHVHDATVTITWNATGDAVAKTEVTCGEDCEDKLTATTEVTSEKKDASCYAAGETVYTAAVTVKDSEGNAVEKVTVVNETSRVEIPATGKHVYETSSNGVCTTPGCGYDHKTVGAEHADNNKDGSCDVCMAVIPVEHVHTFEWVETTPATCTTKGVETETCSCGETGATRDIAALDHDMDEGTVTTAASCEATGVKTFKCERTGCTHTTTETIAALGHNYVEGTCSRCGAADPDNVPACEHVYEMSNPGVCDKCGEPHAPHEPDMLDPDYCSVCYGPINSSASAIPDLFSFLTKDETETVAAEGDEGEEGEDPVTPPADEDEEEKTVEELADEYAKGIVEEKKAEIEAAVNESTGLNAAIEQTVTGGTEDVDTDIEKECWKAAEDYVGTEQAQKALAEDPAAYIDSLDEFKQEAPVSDGKGGYATNEDGSLIMMPLNQQAHQAWEGFWTGVENGDKVDVPVTDEAGNVVGSVQMTMEEIIAAQMDTPMNDLPQKEDGTHMTPNEAVPVYAAQAAAGLTDGIINYWEGSHFGALGFGTSVCLGYTKAFTYLVQCLHPEIYGKNGANTDMSNAANWKTRDEVYVYGEDGKIDINQNYVVDAVRVTFDASVTMYGETEDNFNSDHFWNAVKIDGKWYYADPCYVDVFTEVMMRDRVETDGQMNHLYFIFSHTAAVNMYDGNYKEIKTMYDAVATSTDYEDSWISRIKSNTYFDGGYAYYMYDSTDMLTMMEEYENQNSEADIEDPLYKIVRHKLDDTDAGTNGDEDYETLIVFNYKENDDAEAVARVYDPAAKETVDNELLTELWHKHAAYAEVYPSIAINAAYYNGKVYFNLANCILSYDVATGAVAMVKEYNTVHGKRDTTKAFGGMAFSVVDDGGDFTVENHPIAGMTIKDDGNMYVSVATNFAFISGKADRCDPASEGHGYAYEESNFNDDYNSYMDFGDYDDDELASYGYTKETNDNDEFMWTANFVEKTAMSHLAGNGHEYAAVAVDAACGVDAYTENRCTTCGAIEADSRVYEEGTAIEHHFIKWDETYYTKDDAGSWNKGHCYVCTECGYAVNDPGDAPADSAAQEIKDAYTENKAAYDAAKEIAGHTYVPTDAEWAEDNSSVTFTTLECSAICPERKPYLDCLLDDNTISVTLKEATTFEVTEIENVGICPDGVTKIYKVIAEAEVEGVKYPFTATKAVELEPADCTYVDGICSVCGDSSVKRISGKDRVKTALSVARALKDTLGVEKFDAVIIATGVNEKFADALAGSYLANRKKAPILLYTNAGLSEETVAFIQENLKENGTVYILGGDSAVPTTVEETLSAYNVVRLSGKTRYETNLAILKEAGISGDEILVATGTNFADSLSASAVGLPLLLVNGKNTSLNDAQIEFLNSVAGKKITIIGGDGAVSEEMKAAIEAVTGVTAERVSGKTRHNTSVMIAQKYFPDADFALITYAKNFPDGLAGGPLAYALGAPLLLTNAGQEAIANEYIAAEEIERGYVLGGDSAVSDDTACKVFGLEAERVIEKAYYTA